MNWLQIVLWGWAVLLLLTSLNTVRRIGKPKTEVVTGGEAAISLVFGGFFVTVLVLAALAVKP